MKKVNTSTTTSMLAECERRYKELVTSGCDENVAADRTFDAFECAINSGDTHCFDMRDRLFEETLRQMARKGREYEEV